MYSWWTGEWAFMQLVGIKINEDIRGIIKTTAPSKGKIFVSTVMSPSLKTWEGSCVYGWKETTVISPYKELHMDKQEKTKQSKITSSFTKSSVSSSTIHSYIFDSLTTLSQEHQYHSHKNQHKCLHIHRSIIKYYHVLCDLCSCNPTLSVRFELHSFFHHWQDFLRT